MEQHLVSGEIVEKELKTEPLQIEIRPGESARDAIKRIQAGKGQRTCIIEHSAEYKESEMEEVEISGEKVIAIRVPHEAVRNQDKSALIVRRIAND